MYQSRFPSQISPLSLVERPVSPPAIHRTTKPRRRGVILTELGWQKLLQAEALYTQFGERYSFEELSEKTFLDPRTICRIISRETGVDKRTLTIFFHAFNLRLETGDYAAVGYNQQHGAATNPSPPLLIDSEAELSHLKQRIIADCHCLTVLLGCNRAAQTTLTIKLSPTASPQLTIDTCQHYQLPL